MRIVLYANPEKPDALQARQQLLTLLAGRAEATILDQPDPTVLMAARPDLLVVLGGDGSILKIAHMVWGLNVPVVGINFGKLGYLAAYSLEEFQEHIDLILTGHAPRTQRLMLEGSVYRLDGRGGSEIDEKTGNGRPWKLAELTARQPLYRYAALNDIVINAGEPFRMVQLSVCINDQETTSFRSDGIIVSTSSGSTGYNLSAGGPLMSPDVCALILTPICPHSLSFRPVVLSDSAAVVIHPQRVNAGTKVVFDGQVSREFGPDECVLVRRAARPLVLVENPEMSHWQMLASKLQWARSPTT